MTGRGLRALMAAGASLAAGCASVPEWVSMPGEGSLFSACSDTSFRVAEMRAINTLADHGTVTEYAQSNNGHHVFRSARVSDYALRYRVLESWEGEYRGQSVKCVLVIQESIR